LSIEDLNLGAYSLEELNYAFNHWGTGYSKRSGAERKTERSESLVQLLHSNLNVIPALLMALDDKSKKKGARHTFHS